MAGTLRQLEYFVAVVEEDSFTRAATRLHVTQPALSHQIAALETALGGRLLERLPRSVQLSPLGRVVWTHARATLAEAARTWSAADEVVRLEAGELEVATLYSFSLGVLPAVLRVWGREHPEVRIRLHEHRHADELAEEMRAGRGDLAIGPPPANWSGPIHPLGEEEFVIVLASDDPSAGRARRIRLAALADRDWVHFAPDNGLADVLDQACAAAGFRPTVAVRVEQTATAPALASAGLGPTLIPASMIPRHFDASVLRPSPPIRRQVAAYCRADPDPISVAFIDTAATHSELVPDYLRLARGP